MSIHTMPNGKWRVMWREPTGKQRTKVFDLKSDAELFDKEVRRSRQLNNAYRQIELVLPTARIGRRSASHVYVVAADHSVKIGVAADPRKRLEGLRTGSSVPLKLVRTIRTDDAIRLEASLHARYSMHRLSGEWFDAEPVLADLMPQADDDLLALIDQTAAL